MIHNNAVEYSIVLTTDGSGSMAGEKIRDARDAAASFANDIDLSQNELALVLFGNSVRVISDFSHDLSRIKKAVQGFSAGGGTPFLKAMQKSNNDLLKCASGKLVLVLVTDGQPTDASTWRILNYGSKLKSQGTRIITVAIGQDADRAFLEKLASSREDSHLARFSGQLTETYKKIASGLVVAGKG